MSLLTSIFRLVPPTFRPGFCPKTAQELANALIGGTQLTFLIQEGSFMYNMGSATPTAENRIFPWLYTPDGLWYTFQFGVWVAAYPVPPLCDVRWLWVGTNDAAGLFSFDGGDGSDPGAVVPTQITGSFWQADTLFAARMPLGAGTLPSGTVISTAPSSTGGLEKVSLTAAEMPPHTHDFKVTANNADGGGTGELTGGEFNSPNDGEFNGTTASAGGDGATPPVVVAHTNMSPYIGVYFIKRTGRIWRTLPA